MRATPLLIAAWLCGCGAPAGKIHGSVEGQTLEPLSVLTFQVFTEGFDQVNSRAVQRTDLMVAIIAEGGGCKLLDHARPDHRPAELWLNLLSTTRVTGTFFDGADTLASAPPANTALFWPDGATTCGQLNSSSLTITHATFSGNIRGSFEASFGDDHLAGEFDATDCGGPPRPDPSSNGCF